MKTKSGEIITIKEAGKRWVEGIKNLTPMQRLSNERNSTFVSLVGFLVCLVSIIIFRDKIIVNWFAYGLILIFIGSAWSYFIKFISLNKQLKQLKEMLKE